MPVCLYDYILWSLIQNLMSCTRKLVPCVKLLKQNYEEEWPKLALHKFYGHHHKLVDRYDVSVIDSLSTCFRGHTIEVPIVTIWLSGDSHGGWYMHSRRRLPCRRYQSLVSLFFKFMQFYYFFPLHSFA